MDTLKVSGWILVGLSAGTAGAIGAGSVLLACLAVLKGEPLPLTAWITAGVTGLVTASRDIRGFLSLPPVDLLRPPQ